jgi:voltage-gated potassium channel
MKQRIYSVLSESKRPGDISWFFDLFIISLILLNVLAILLESVEGLRIRYSKVFNYFEISSGNLYKPLKISMYIVIIYIVNK